MTLRESFKYAPSLILLELKAIKKDIEYIKHKMEDDILTPEEEKLVKQALKNHREGKTISLKEFKKCMKSS